MPIQMDGAPPSTKFKRRSINFLKLALDKMEHKIVASKVEWVKHHEGRNQKTGKSSIRSDKLSVAEMAQVVGFRI